MRNRWLVFVLSLFVLAGIPPTTASDFKYLTLGGAQPLGATGNTLTSYTFLNNTDQGEIVFQVPDNHGARTMAITQVGYRSSAVGTGAPLFRIELQTVGTDGNPTGTVVGGGSPAQTADFAFGTANTFIWVPLANTYTANCGDFLAWVFKYRSGTINGQQLGINSSGGGNSVFPYQIQNVAGARTRPNLGAPIYGIGTASFKFGWPLQSFTSTAINSTVEKGMSFTIPASQVQSYKVAGVRIQCILPAAGKSELISLYQGTTSLQSMTLDTDFLKENANTRSFTIWFSDATLPTLSGGVEYTLGVAPQDVGNNITLTTWDFNAAGDMDAISGGQAWYFVTRPTGGGTAFTQVLTSRPQIELIISDWTAPSRGVIGSLPPRRSLKPGFFPAKRVVSASWRLGRPPGGRSDARLGARRRAIRG